MGKSQCLPPSVKQAWAASGVLINILGQGMVLSYPSCLLPGLKDPESSIQVTLSTASWLASSVGLSSMLGFIISSYLMDRLGRKLTYIFVILPGTCGWMLIYFAEDVTTLMIGRILGGITAGATVTLGAIVIGEYTSPTLRGVFLNMKTACFCVGNTMVHVTGNFLHWRTVAICGLVPHILALLIIATWPESPSWLASENKYEASRQAFVWLRGTGEESMQEYDQLIKAQKERFTENRSFLTKLKELFKKFGRKDFVIPVLIIFCGTIIIEGCGRHNFPAYATTIIQEISGNDSQYFSYTIGIDLIVTVSTIVSSAFVKIMKRRTLLFSTGIAALVVLFTTCFYQFLVTKEAISKDHTWVPLSMLAIYFVLANLGCTTIPFTLLGEVFPLVHKSAGSVVSGMSLSLLLLVALKVTPYLLVYMKFHGTFAIFGITTAGGLLVLYFILPETKDRTLQEIEDYFNCGKFKNEITAEHEDEEALTSLTSK